MTDLLLYVNDTQQTYEIIVWAVGILLIIALLILMFWQRRVGRELQEEVRQLAGERSRDVEYDFVLKAMGLSVWHIDTTTGQLTFDKDFRPKRELMGTDGGTLSENASLLVPEDAQRAYKRISKISVLASPRTTTSNTASFRPTPRSSTGKRAMPSLPSATSAAVPHVS